MSGRGWVLHVDRREAELRAEAGVLHVRATGRRKQSYPLRELALVVLDGSPRTDTHTLRALADAGVATIMAGGRQQQAASWVAPGLSGSIRLRHAQHLAHADSSRRLAVAKCVVHQKFFAAASVADELGWASEASALRSATDRLPGCRDLAALQGLEGALAARWFSAMGASMPTHWGFSGRARRPPPCPANAMLSYLYAVMCGEAQSAVQCLGLDPALGFLHAMVAGRPGMALDAMESLRPGVDAIVLSVLRDTRLEPRFFRFDSGACLMDKPARGLLMSAFAEARAAWPGTGTSLHRHLMRQVRALAQSIDRDASDELPDDDIGDP